jgi:hypothetical protein
MKKKQLKNNESAHMNKNKFTDLPLFIILFVIKTLSFV